MFTHLKVDILFYLFTFSLFLLHKQQINCFFCNIINIKKQCYDVVKVTIPDTPSLYFTMRQDREGVFMIKFNSVLSILALVLVFGLAFSGCTNGSPDDDETLVEPPRPILPAKEVTLTLTNSDSLGEDVTRLKIIDADPLYEQDILIRPDQTIEIKIPLRPLILNTDGSSYFCSWIYVCFSDADDFVPSVLIDGTEYSYDLNLVR